MESGKKLASGDMLALQNDVYSAFDRFCAERFVYALDHTQNLSARAQQARELMRDWDGKMTVASAAATIEARSNRTLARLLLEPKLEAGRKSLPSEMKPLAFSDLHWSMMSVWMENILLKQPKRWLPENYPNYDALLAAAVEAVVRDPETPHDLMGQGFSARNSKPGLRQDTGAAPLDGNRNCASAGRRAHGQASREVIRTIGEVHGRFVQLRREHAQRRDRAGRKFPQSLLLGPVEGLVRGIDLHASVLPRRSREDKVPHSATDTLVL
ncbi:MAG: hypothetical protein DMG68_11355 [Acidobacteria bacterium]|nr:MAG: hypothetical protein DMG68_11355 [Acidobacteriota bacterium]